MRGRGGWRAVPALALAGGAACSDPLAPSSGNDNPPVVKPGGAGVWATGTNRWAAYLDGDRAPANPKAQALTQVVLGWMNRH